MEENKIIAYKGFDENLCCRGFQYEIGKEYVQEGEMPTLEDFVEDLKCFLKYLPEFIKS